MPKDGEGFVVWQSFADLAMGLMAVFALVLILLLWRQGRSNLELRQQAEQLELERAEFAVELLEIISSTHRIVESQDAAEAWVRHLFAQDQCLLELSPTGALRTRALDSEGREGPGGAVGDLYATGETVLHQQGRDALRSCCSNFIRLAYCLSPMTAEEREKDPDSERWSRLCVSGLTGDEGGAGGDPETVQLLREGIESLVLEGNTDRTPLKPGGAPGVPIRRWFAGGAKDERRCFVDNAFLGAERARQALAHLLMLVDDEVCPLDALESDARQHALRVLMSKVRIESPSFGRYQVGPPSWRRGSHRDVCTSEGACPSARNLSLRLRWEKAELRRPFEAVRCSICRLLGDETSSISKGLRSTEALPPEKRRRLDRLLRGQPSLAEGANGVENIYERLSCDELPEDSCPARR